MKYGTRTCVEDSQAVLTRLHLVTESVIKETRLSPRMVSPVLHVLTEMKGRNLIVNNVQQEEWEATIGVRKKRNVNTNTELATKHAHCRHIPSKSMGNVRNVRLETFGAQKKKSVIIHILNHVTENVMKEAPQNIAQSTTRVLRHLSHVIYAVQESYFMMQLCFPLDYFNNVILL